jgi:sugar lactone lactonase YvrE
MESAYATFGWGRPSGLLLKHEPRSGLTTAIADGFWFANGVALSSGEDFIVMADSLQAKVVR